MNNIRKQTGKNKKGYAILELLFYISLFAVLAIVVINSMITMTKSLKETSIQAELSESGSIMERLGRDIKSAYDISSLTSTDLILSEKDSSGASKNVEFKLSGTDLELWDSGSKVGNLNTDTIAVTALTFTAINSAQGKAVKISMTVKPLNDTYGRTENFYDTVALRGIYK